MIDAGILRIGRTIVKTMVLFYLPAWRSIGVYVWRKGVHVQT